MASSAALATMFASTSLSPVLEGVVVIGAEVGAGGSVSTPSSASLYTKPLDGEAVGEELFRGVTLSSPPNGRSLSCFEFRSLAMRASWDSVWGRDVGYS